MLAIELLRSERERVEAALSKRMDVVDLDPILELDDSRRSLLQRAEEARSRRNQLSAEIGGLRRDGADSSALEEQSSNLGDEIASIEAELAEVETTLRDQLAEFPNLPEDDVVAGGKESNRVTKTWGSQPDVGSDPRDHVELSTSLGLVDFERGRKLGGKGFWLYTGIGAALEWALLDYFCRTHLAAGYTFMLPPHLLLDECGFAAGQFPKFADDVFHLDTGNGDRGRFLLPTAETAILNVYAGEVLDHDDLPQRAFAYTPCYRREAGGYRSDERGTVRGHQFNKVEIFQFVEPGAGRDALLEMLAHAESVVESLGLHYQTSLLAASDASAAMKITYDVEVWIPSIGDYKEVSSVSFAGDYQARRAAIRYRPDGSKKTDFVHTLNGSALATSRLVPAILEQHQQQDGSVVVPEPLRAWLGTDVLEPVA